MSAFTYRDLRNAGVPESRARLLTTQGIEMYQETRQIGQTPDKRAVWCNEGEEPFLVAADAAGNWFALPAGDFQPLPEPHKTFEEIHKPQPVLGPHPYVAGSIHRGEQGETVWR